MRPIKAVVQSVFGKVGIKIKLESGLVTLLSTPKHYHVGENIIVTYDFTTNKVVKIVNAYDEEDIPESCVDLD